MFPAICVAQHSIKGSLAPAEDYKWVILYKVTPTHSEYVANAAVKEEGKFELQLDSTVTKGMYRLVYALPQEEHNFDIIYNAEEDIEFAFDRETGVQFKTSAENTLMSSYTNSMAMVSQSIGNFFRQQSTDTTALISIFETQKFTQDEFEKNAKGTIALHFIKANRPYIPEGYEDIKAYIQNLKVHYFDHVDFNNDILQSSNFLVERTLNYVFGMTSEADETTTYKQNVDDVVIAMQDADITIKKLLLEILWQQMAEAGYEEVANHISDAYLFEIAQKLDDAKLMETLSLFKSLSIGQPAPDFVVESASNNKVNLSQLEEAEQYIVVFWSSTCSHCLEEMPQLHDYVKGFEKGKVKVVAIGLEDEELRWKNATVNFPEFLHVIGLGKWDNEIGNSYNVTSTPTYFVLDKDKKILAKPYDFKTLKKLFGK